MANKNDNKSLFLYTSLIFIVAVLLIVLSFFGQTNLKKSQPPVEASAEPSNSGITERAAVLSEENKNLIEENTALKAENQELLKKQTMNDILLSANGYFSLGNNAKALEMLNAVIYDELSVDQKIIYDNIKTAIDAAEQN